MVPVVCVMTVLAVTLTVAVPGVRVMVGEVLVRRSGILGVGVPVVCAVRPGG